MQKAVETYDCHEKYAGQYREGHSVLAPVSHLVTRAGLEITLDLDGNFYSARTVDKSEPKILIPVTENSAGRSGTTICAHPLCDQLGYLAPYNTAKNQDYITKLTDWSESEYSHPLLVPVLAYIKSGKILEDLQSHDLIKLDEKGLPHDEKLMVCWRVLGIDGEEACWKNTELFRCFIQYYRSISGDSKQNICAITGEKTRIAQQHPKGIISFCGNAKLISANDDRNFTYRGRFTQDEQALTIGYEASQKAHNALKWLASEQGSQAVYGGRTFLCWNPRGIKICHAAGAFRRKEQPVTKPTEYKEALQKTLAGYQSQLPAKEGVVIAAFDAATSGRLSLSYYNELMGSDFIQRLYQWDLRCCWITQNFGIQSPGLYQIANCAFGILRKQGNTVLQEIDDKILKQQIQRLISCRIDGAPIPVDFIKGLMQKAASHLAHHKSVEDGILSTACAVIRKYRYDRFKEDWNMALEQEKKDISYQYGRLLAVLEKAERDTYKDSDSDREPNAIRLQSVFCQRPMYAAANIEKQLERAYFPRLKIGSRIYYKNLIGQIMEQINAFPQQEWNKPLKETYLMGYYLQRNELYTKKDKSETNMEDENND